VIDEGGRADLDSAAAQHVFAAMPSATSDSRRRLRAEQSLPRFEPCLRDARTDPACRAGSPAARKLLIAAEALRALGHAISCAVTRQKPEETPMNYTVNNVARSTDGWGFSIVDSRSSTPLVRIEFEHQEKAREAHWVIGQAIAIAVKITPQASAE